MRLRRERSRCAVDGFGDDEQARRAADHRAHGSAGHEDQTSVCPYRLSPRSGIDYLSSDDAEAGRGSPGLQLDLCGDRQVFEKAKVRIAMAADDDRLIAAGQNAAWSVARRECEDVARISVQDDEVLVTAGDSVRQQARDGMVICPGPGGMRTSVLQMRDPAPFEQALREPRLALDPVANA